MNDRNVNPIPSNGTNSADGSSIEVTTIAVYLSDVGGPTSIDELQ